MLLVEDRQTYQTCALGLLANWGIKPQIACNGTEALRFAAQDTADIILMSVEIPHMTGFDAAVQIRRIERQSSCGKRVPIVACSVSDQECAGPQLAASGMDDVLLKPYRLHAMAECLNRWLPGKVAASIV